MLKVKKKGCSWIQMTLILPNKREWFGYRMSWSAKRPIRKDYLLLIWKWKKKKIFLKTDKNTTLQRKVSTPQSFKRKIQLIFLKILLNKLILKSPCRFDQRSLSSPWLTKCLPIFLNYVLTWSFQKRYVGNLSKTRSQSSTWPLDRSNFWTTSRPDPPKRGT